MTANPRPQTKGPVSLFLLSMLICSPAWAIEDFLGSYEGYPITVLLIPASVFLFLINFIIWGKRPIFFNRTSEVLGLALSGVSIVTAIVQLLFVRSHNGYILPSLLAFWCSLMTILFLITQMIIIAIQGRYKVVNIDKNKNRISFLFFVLPLAFIAVLFLR